MTGSKEELDNVLKEVIELVPETAESIEAKKQEFGEEKWAALAQRLILQITDIIWVEHLEVMSYTRSSVNLRAYGQRDPLNEYRKEGKRLFKEMQDTTLYRIAEVIPNMQPEAIKKEAEELQKRQARAQQSGGGTNTRKKKKQRISNKQYGRNDIVKITDGSETKEMKFKKAERLIQNEGWKIVEK